MSYTDVIEQIKNLPRYREYTCPNCGQQQKAYTLEIHAICKVCKTRVKLRGYASMGSEVEDVIEAVLAWLGRGDELTFALQRKEVIDSESAIDPDAEQ